MNKSVISPIVSLCLSFCLSFVSIYLQAQEAVLQTTSNPLIEQGYVNTDKGQIHYWQAGEGPTLLLVHQTSSSSEEYAGMVPFLADKYRLVSFDWPGHGHSDDPEKEIGIEGFTDAAEAVLAHLDIENFHVLGHHGGALIAMNLAFRHPDRVKKIILSGTSGIKTKEEAEAFTEDLDIDRRRYLDREGKSLDEAWQRFIGYMPKSSPEEILIPYLNSTAMRVKPYSFYNEILKWNRTPVLQSLKDRSMLIMQGENDIYVSHQETLMEILPNSRRIVVEDAGVFIFFEVPELSSEIVSDFLSEL